MSTRYPTRTLFDVVMGVPVPTLEAGNEDQRDALADAPTPMDRWAAAGFPCDDCGAPMRGVTTDEGGAWRCSDCDLTIV